MKALASWPRLLVQLILRPLSRAFCTAGSRRLMRVPMMEIATSSSTSVKAWRRREDRMMRFLSWRWSSGTMPSAVRLPAAFRLSGRSRSRCRGHGLTEACRCGCDDCLRAGWSRRRPAGSGRFIDRGTVWIPRRPHRRALLPRFAPPFRRHQDSGSDEHRGNAAKSPKQ